MLVRYIALVTAAYVAAFAFVLMRAGHPAIPAFVAIGAVVLGSVAISVLGTLRALQLGEQTQSPNPRFVLPSLIHGLVIAVIVIAGVVT